MRVLVLQLIVILGLSGGALLAQPAPPPSTELFRTIAALDQELFQAYNTCDIEKFGNFFAEDLEFYHDQSGLSRSRQTTIDALKKNICGKVRREIVPETLQVFPLKNFGAVQTGVHRFCDAKLDKCGKESGEAKYVHLWQNDNGRWRITRVISYDHCSRCSK